MLLYNSAVYLNFMATITNQKKMGLNFRSNVFYVYEFTFLKNNST